MEFINSLGLRSDVIVTVRTVDAHDLRKESKSLFKNFIKMEEQIGSPSLARNDRIIDDFVQVYVELTTDIHVRVLMGNPRIVFEPDVVLEIFRYFRTRYKDTSTPERIVSPRSLEEFGDVTFSNNTWLGNNLCLSHTRKMYVSGDVIIDGSGHNIELFARDQTPLIYIA